jgi:ATP-binding cassette subfamily B protein/ATP-binding cassette subfamily B multidrug efflux pump
LGILGILNGMFEVAIYWGVGWLVDILAASSADRLLDENWLMLVLLAAFILVARPLIAIATVAVENLVIVPAFFNQVRWQSFRAVNLQPLAFFQRDFAGRIATKVVQGGQALGDFLISLLQSMWSFAAFIVLSLSLLVTLHPMLGAVIVVWGFFYGWIVVALLPKLREQGRERADAKSIMSGKLVDSFTNIQAVKLFDSDRREDEFVRGGLANLVEKTLQVSRTVTSIRIYFNILNGLLIGALGAVSIYLWMAAILSTGEVAVVLGLGIRLNNVSGWMMMNLNGMVRNFATVQDSIRTIAVPPTMTDRPDAALQPPATGLIEFDQVTFHYGKGTGVIDDLTLSVQPGEKVGLVGPSGAGKTTLMNLVLRLFDVEGGAIRVDGLDVRDVTQGTLRNQFSVVTQEPLLMHRSLRDNIAYGRPSAEQAEIVAAAEQAQADEFIAGLADERGRAGYDAFVGERGVKLSGGQRQRIAIARILLRNAPILILDEATSALDSEIEAAIQENLRVLMRQKTVIAIAHRLSTIAAMDRLVVMDKGQIVEQGTHTELIAREGLYNRLWRRQSGGFLNVDTLAAE